MSYTIFLEVILLLFHEIYGCYYKTVAQILKKAVTGSLTVNDITEIINKNAFGESHLTIIPAIKNQKWQLLDKDLHTPIKYPPTFPLTTLELRWLKAISLDPRMALFNVNTDELIDIEPLFTTEDYIVFDKYHDGDPFQQQSYIKNFRIIIDAIHKKRKLRIQYIGRNGGKYLIVYCIPLKLEYSEKDDKFRLFTTGSNQVSVMNIARIKHCELANDCANVDVTQKTKQRKSFVMEIDDQRNALERVMLHFVHFEKQGEKLDDRRFRVKIYYEYDDETELVIRVLSFGPLVNIIEPEEFRTLIKERLIMQKSCELRTNPK